MRFGFRSSAISMYSISRHEAIVQYLINRKKERCGAFRSRTEEEPQSRTSYARERNASGYMCGGGSSFFRWGQGVESVRSTFDRSFGGSDCRAGFQKKPRTQRSSSRPTQSNHSIHHGLFWGAVCV